MEGEQLYFGGEKKKGKRGLNFLPVTQILAMLVSMACHEDNSGALDECG